MSGTISSTDPIEFLNPGRIWKLGHKGHLNKIDVSGVVSISGDLHCDNKIYGNYMDLSSDLVVGGKTTFKGVTYRQIDSDLSYEYHNGSLGLAKHYLPKQDDTTSIKLISNSDTLFSVLAGAVPTDIVRSTELGRMMIVGENGYYASSSDGIDWDTTGTTSTNKLKQVIWVPEQNQFVIIGDTGYIAISKDSISIDTTTTIPDVVSVRSIAFSPQLGIYVLVGTNGQNVTFSSTSPDAITWSNRIIHQGISFPIQHLTSVIWVPEIKRFVAVGMHIPTVTHNRYPYYAASTDGISWDISGVIPTARTQSQLFSVAWSREQGRLAAVGDGGFYASAKAEENSIEWDFYGGVVGLDKITKVVWATHLQRFVAVAQNGFVGNYMSSLDGAIWDVSGDMPKPCVGMCWAEDLGRLIIPDNIGSVFYTDPRYLFQTTYNLFEDTVLHKVRVNGDVSFQEDVDISGRLTARKFTVLEDVSFNANVDIEDNLTVYGDITTTGTGRFDNMYATGAIHGPFNFVLDPSGHNDNTGVVIIKGNLEVLGLTTTINFLRLDLDDHVILFSGNATSVFQTYGSGLEVSGGHTFLYVEGNVWESNRDISSPGLTTTILNSKHIDTSSLNVELDLYVGRDASFSQDVEISGKLYGNTMVMDGEASFNGDVNIGDDLVVSGVSTFEKRVDISENLYVNGDVSFQRNVDVSGKFYATSIVAETLLVFGDVSFINSVDIPVINNDLSLNGDVDISENLFVNGDVSFQRNLDVSGRIVGTELIIGQGYTFPNGTAADSTTSGSHALLGNMRIGQVGFNDWVGLRHNNLGGSSNYALMQSNTGNTLINASANQHLNFNIANTVKMRLDSNGNFGIGTTNNITSILTVVGDTSLNGALDVSDDLFVNGDVSFQRNLDVSGKLFATRLDIGNLDVSDGLYVNGDVSFQRNLDISGKLVVTRVEALDVSFRNVDISNELTVKGDVSFNGKVIFSDFIDASDLMVGPVSNGNNTYQGIKHKGVGSNLGYAIVQNENGRTIINSSLDEPIEFRHQAQLHAVFRGGNFGIGTAFPTSDLTLLGDAELMGNVDISDHLYVNGDVSFQRNLDVSGIITAEKLQIVGDIVFSGAEIVDISDRLLVNQIAFDGMRNDINVLNSESNIIVAVGIDTVTSTNTIAYSDDLGDNWRAVPSSSTIFSATGVGANDIAYNGTIWVAVGRGNNTVAYSKNGINWVGNGKPFSHSGRCVIYESDSGRWLAGGQSGIDTLAYSYDGITWVGLGKSAMSNKIMGLAYNGERYVACGEGTNQLVYSDDLENWTAISPSPYQRGRCVIWTGRVWLTGGSKGTGTNTLIFSQDGENWIDIQNGNNPLQGSANIFSTVCNDVVSNGSVIVAVGKGTNTIAYSLDFGATFTGLGNAFISFEGKSVEWCGTHWIASGVGNELFKSINGIDWTEITGRSELTAIGIAWNNAIYPTIGLLSERISALETATAASSAVAYSSFACVKGASLGTVISLTELTWIDVTSAGYSLTISPSSPNSYIKLELKLNYNCCRIGGQTISFRVKNNSGDVIFTDTSLGYGFGIIYTGVYTSIYIDDTGYNSPVTYHVEYHVDTTGFSTNFSNPIGILGHDLGNSNCFIAQELYIA